MKLEILTSMIEIWEEIFSHVTSHSQEKIMGGCEKLTWKSGKIILDEELRTLTNEIFLRKSAPSLESDRPQVSFDDTFKI